MISAPSLTCPFSIDFINSAASEQKSKDSSKVQKIVKYFLKNPKAYLSMLQSTSDYSARLFIGIQNMLYKEIKHLSRTPFSRESLVEKTVSAGAGAGAGSSSVAIKEFESPVSDTYKDQISSVAKIFKNSSFNDLHPLKKDLVITCSDGSCLLSKRIFSMHNEYFRGMFSSRSRESIKVDPDEFCSLKHHVIDYSQYTKDCIEGLNQYFSGTLDIENLSLKTTIQLIQLSDMIEENDLYDLLKTHLRTISLKFFKDHNVNMKVFVKKGEMPKCFITPNQIGLCENDYAASLGIAPESDLGFFLSSLVNGVILDTKEDASFIADGMEFLSPLLQKRLGYVYLTDHFISKNLSKADVIKTISESELEIGYYFAKKMSTESLKIIFSSSLPCEERNCYFEEGLSIHFRDDDFLDEKNPVRLLKTLGHTFTVNDRLFANRRYHRTLEETIRSVRDEVGSLFEYYDYDPIASNFFGFGQDTELRLP